MHCGEQFCGVLGMRGGQRVLSLPNILSTDEAQTRVLDKSRAIVAEGSVKQLELLQPLVFLLLMQRIENNFRRMVP